VVRKTLLTYWNTVSFLSLYARTSDFQPATASIPPIEQRTVLDRWVLSEANRVAREVDGALEEFDTQRAGRELATFIDDLSNWYVRRSRRRFWDGDLAALATLHEALQIITLLMAPFTPFITERVWADMFAQTDPALPESVHLARWPEADPDLIDDKLAAQMDLVRRVVELGRGARAEGKAKTRQPLARALVSAHGWDELPDELRATVAEELNVISLDSLGSQVATELVDVVVKANFRSLGQRFAKDTPRIAAVVAEADAAVIARELRETGSTSVTVDALGEVTLTAEDVVITETPREGWSVASEAGASVALDLQLTDELVVLGTARELVRLIQEARKSAGFDVSDRITLNWSSANPTVVSAFADHGQLIAGEVLATAVTESSEAIENGYVASDDELGASISVHRS
jgi:isoleucyl-tRNA synthetase